MDVILFDGAAHQSLWPLTATKPVAKLRIGILTIEEKWNYFSEFDIWDFLKLYFYGVTLCH